MVSVRQDCGQILIPSFDLHRVFLQDVILSAGSIGQRKKRDAHQQNRRAAQNACLHDDAHKGHAFYHQLNPVTDRLVTRPETALYLSADTVYQCAGLAVLYVPVLKRRLLLHEPVP